MGWFIINRLVAMVLSPMGYLSPMGTLMGSLWDLYGTSIPYGFSMGTPITLLRCYGDSYSLPTPLLCHSVALVHP